MADALHLVIPAVRETFIKHKALVEGAVVQVPDAALHMALDEHTNSIAVIMKHVAGNLRSRWTDFLSSDGEKPARNRDGEFVDTHPTRAAIMADWDSGWECLIGALDALQPSDLSRTVTIRGEPHTVPLAIERSLAHTAYHAGQIVLLARVLFERSDAGGGGKAWKVLTLPRAPRPA